MADVATKATPTRTSTSIPRRTLKAPTAAGATTSAASPTKATSKVTAAATTTTAATITPRKARTPSISSLPTTSPSPTKIATSSHTRTVSSIVTPTAVTTTTPKRASSRAPSVTESPLSASKIKKPTLSSSGSSTSRLATPSSQSRPGTATGRTTTASTSAAAKPTHRSTSSLSSTQPLASKSGSSSSLLSPTTSRVRAPPSSPTTSTPAIKASKIPARSPVSKSGIPTASPGAKAKASASSIPTASTTPAKPKARAVVQLGDSEASVISASSNSNATTVVITEVEAESANEPSTDSLSYEDIFSDAKPLPKSNNEDAIPFPSLDSLDDFDTSFDDTNDFDENPADDHVEPINEKNSFVDDLDLDLNDGQYETEPIVEVIGKPQEEEKEFTAESVVHQHKYEPRIVIDTTPAMLSGNVNKRDISSSPFSIAESDLHTPFSPLSAGYPQSPSVGPLPSPSSAAQFNNEDLPKVVSLRSHDETIEMRLEEMLKTEMEEEAKEAAEIVSIEATSDPIEKELPEIDSTEALGQIDAVDTTETNVPAADPFPEVAPVEVPVNEPVNDVLMDNAMSDELGLLDDEELGNSLDVVFAPEAEVPVVDMAEPVAALPELPIVEPNPTVTTSIEVAEEPQPDIQPVPALSESPALNINEQELDDLFANVLEEDLFPDVSKPKEEESVRDQQTTSVNPSARASAVGSKRNSVTASHASEKADANAMDFASEVLSTSRSSLNHSYLQPATRAPAPTVVLDSDVYVPSPPSHEPEEEAELQSEPQESNIATAVVNEEDEFLERERRRTEMADRLREMERVRREEEDYRLLTMLSTEGNKEEAETYEEEVHDEDNEHSENNNAVDAFGTSMNQSSEAKEVEVTETGVISAQNHDSIPHGRYSIAENDKESVPVPALPERAAPQNPHQRLMDGIEMVKLPRSGSPRSVRVWLQMIEGEWELAWASKKKKPSQAKLILKECSLSVGCGKGLFVNKKFMGKYNELLCFSLIHPSRSLDFVAQSPIDHADMTMAINPLSKKS